MRIGVDLSTWVNGRGYGRYTRELTAALVALAPHHEFLGYVERQSVERVTLDAANLTVRPVVQSQAPSVAASAAGSRSPLDMLRFSRAVWGDRPDVFFSPSVYTYFPLPPRQRAAVALHDAIAERFPELTFPSRRARAFWRAKVRVALWQATVVLTVSDFSAQELRAVFGLPADCLRVTGEAPARTYRPSDDPSAIRAAAERQGLPPEARWFTYVGGFNPHKHVDDIVRAFAAVAQRDGATPLYLLLVGSTTTDVFHGNLDAVRRAVAEQGVADRVRWTGFVPDDELRHLHAGARGLVMFSDSEGFGLPAVEAAACGAPVIAPTASPLPSLLQGGGLFVAPRDVDALRAALQSLATDDALRATLGMAARTRAAGLTWRDAARRTLDALEEIAP